MTNKSTINIVAACDEAFAQHLAAMLASLLDNNPGEKFRIFILSDIADATFKKIASVDSHGAAECVHIRIDPTHFIHFPITGYWSSAIYYRLGVGSLLPTDVTRVLYLDSDIIVTQPIAALWALDLKGHILAAVEDKAFFDHNKLGFPRDIPYFNSGVMLIDLVRWRSESVEERTRQFLVNNRRRITNGDQCTLNFILIGQWLALDERWNFQTSFFCNYRPPDWLGTLIEARLPDLYAASIVHYSAQSKPWHYLSDHPLKHLYWKYLRHTPWKWYVPEDKTFRNIVLKYFRTYLPGVMLAYYNAKHLPRRLAKKILPKPVQRWVKITILKKDPYNLDVKC